MLLRSRSQGRLLLGAAISHHPLIIPIHYTLLEPMWMFLGMLLGMHLGMHP